MTNNSLKSNLRCDGLHCTSPDTEVHIIPLDRSNNAHLCESCYQHELAYNEQLELDGFPRTLPDIPFSVYPNLLD